MKTTFLVASLLFATAFPAEQINDALIVGVSKANPIMDTAVLLKISQKLGAHIVKRNSKTAFQFNGGGLEKYLAFQFLVDTVIVDPKKEFLVTENGEVELWRTQKKSSLYIYRVSIGSTDYTKVDDFLTNAYLMETGEVKFNSSQYYYLRPKSDKEFWGKTLISQGLGAQYICSGNPFAQVAWLEVGFGYFIDALSYGLIIGGLVEKESVQNKILTVAAGIAFSAAFKLSFNGFMFKPQLNIYNRVANSGYPVPQENMLIERFREYSKDTTNVKDIN